MGDGPGLAVTAARRVNLQRLLGLLLLSGSGPLLAQGTAAARSGAAAKGPILILGDSLSAEYGLSRGSGWVSLLSRRLTEQRMNLEVVNASISGETTAGGRTRLPELLTRHKPSVVIIELGGNDALRGLALAATEANLADMARAARQAGAQVLLLGMMMPPNYGRAYAEAFAALFKRVSTQEKTALHPFFLERIADRIEYFQADRIHPTEAAQPLLLDTVWPTLGRLLKAG